MFTLLESLNTTIFSKTKKTLFLNKKNDEFNIILNNHNEIEKNEVYISDETYFERYRKALKKINEIKKERGLINDSNNSLFNNSSSVIYTINKSTHNIEHQKTYN